MSALVKGTHIKAMLKGVGKEGADRCTKLTRRAALALSACANPFVKCSVMVCYELRLVKFHSFSSFRQHLH